MEAIEVARQFHCDASMVSRLSVDDETVRDVKTAKKIVEVIDKQITTQAEPSHLPPREKRLWLNEQ